MNSFTNSLTALAFAIVALFLLPVNLLAASESDLEGPPPLDLNAPPSTGPIGPATASAPPEVVGRNATAPASPSQNVTINLINRLVQRGALTAADASDLIRLAEQDAATAQEKASEETVTESDDTVRVTYVPESVKAQIKEEIQYDVMKQAVEENWAVPRSFPDWAKRLRFNADVRVRAEGVFFPDGNATGFGSSFWDYNAINTGSPFDFTNTSVNPPFPNVDQDRRRARLRARFGLESELGGGFTAGLRIATGSNSSPVSQNQTFGANGGNFSNYAIWLDRGFVKYETGIKDKNLNVFLGRFDNPFFSSEVIWDSDLAFDGIAVSGRYQVAEGFVPFATAGAFPVYNTDFNFSTNQPNKFKSEDRWLQAVQLGADWQVVEDFSIKLAGAFYNFVNVDGEVSNPYTPLTNADAGNTDATRPSFAQRGNTYTALREILPDASNAFGTTNQWQYFGLATPYRIAALTARLDYSGFDPLRLWVTGEVLKNVAFDKDKINLKGPSNLKGAVNNNAPNTGLFDGGDLAWMLRLNFGHQALEKLWDWNVGIGYRYVETDAVIDGFADSDFGGGGTNLKGYTFGGNVALAPRVSTGVRWSSAEAIAGPTFKQDLLQFDLNAKF